MLLLKQILSASTPDSLKETVVENFELLMDSGVTKPCANITLGDKVAIVRSVALQRVILRTLGELTQFRDGLQCLGVGKEIAEHREILQEFYVKTKTSKLTAGIFIFLFICLFVILLLLLRIFTSYRYC